MEQVGPVLLIVLGLVVVGAIFWFSWQAKKKRRAELAAFASRHGMTYSEHDPVGLLSLDFTLFTLGDGRGVENVVSGTWRDLPVHEADYWYYTETRDSKGKTSRSYKRFSIVVADLPAFMPWVGIAKENILTRFADAVGFRDIEFELEDFNRRFQVKASDREFAFKLVDARMIRWLMEHGQGYGFEVQGQHLLVSCGRLGVAELPSVLDTVMAFRDQVPRMVWNEYGTGGPAPTERVQAATPARPITPVTPVNPDPTPRRPDVDERSPA